MTIDTRIKEQIANSGMMIMRERYSDKPLGIAFQEEGFKYKANKMGKVPYFRNARITVN